METKTMNKRKVYKADKCHTMTISIASEYSNIYSLAEARCLSQTEIIARLNAVNTDWLRSVDHHYLQGVKDTLYKLHWSNLVYTYVVDGVRLSIESEEYNAIPAQWIHENCAGTGAYAYRSDLSKLF